jgi:hypothetical protein
VGIQAALIGGALLAVFLAYQGITNHLDTDDERVAALSTATARVRSGEEQRVAMVAEHNAAILELKTSFLQAQHDREMSERNHAETQDKLADAIVEANRIEQKYESGRLAKLAAAKGGLLTRLARSGAAKRNKEWQELSQ